MSSSSVNLGGGRLGAGLRGMVVLLMEVNSRGGGEILKSWVRKQMHRHLPPNARIRRFLMFISQTTEAGPVHKRVLHAAPHHAREAGGTRAASCCNARWNITDLWRSQRGEIPVASPPFPRHRLSPSSPQPSFRDSTSSPTLVVLHPHHWPVSPLQQHTRCFAHLQPQCPPCAPCKRCLAPRTLPAAIRRVA
jgi:hypothetical protein